jgi:hypothetical protein
MDDRFWLPHSETKNILKVKEIPCSNQMTRLIDVAPPEECGENFKEGIALAEEYGCLEQYKVLDGGVLIALDGVWFHTPEKVHCDHCLHITKDGKRTYYHSMTAAVVVRPGSEVVLPLMPEMIRNEDSENGMYKPGKVSEQRSYEKQKQDCERNGTRRLLKKQGEYYRQLKATLLGDLYANHNTCKDESHPWIAEQFKYGEPETLTIVEWNGRNHLEHRYKWVNGVENRADGEKLRVNYLYFEIYNKEHDKITYKNSWITDKTVTGGNVKLLAECARARGKIENENNNVLKNYGYHLEHNFGHGEDHACEIYCILNLLAFLTHGLMILCDEKFIKVRSYFRRREEFYNALRAFFWAFDFPSWKQFLLFVISHAKGG